ncbi:MAG: DUF3536 domain-containing protein, partial [Ignavibacteria bacterium]
CGKSDESSSQQWRKPLRESLDFLRDSLAAIFEEKGNYFLKDVWNARNDYINLMLNNSSEGKEKFFYFHSKRYLEESETELCLRLLEMQKYSLLMFTSCGWFFSDLSGIETIQILEYAARAIELSNEISTNNLEEVFLEKLSEARSNLPEYSDGRDLYMKKVKRSYNSVS